MKKRLFAMLLALVMVVSMLPVATFAAESTCPYATDGQHDYSSSTGRCTNYTGSFMNRKTCNAECPHEHYEDGECTTCGMECSHSYSDKNSSTPSGKCSKCGAACQHGYTQGGRKCGTCGITVCNNNHSYQNGACTKCHKACSHTKSSGWQSTSAFENGVCSVCDYECPHAEYGWDNKCSVCKMAKPNCTNHEYENGKCKKCGTSCSHKKNNQSAWVNGTCDVCDLVCGHTAGYNNQNKCKTCGLTKCTNHEYVAGTNKCKNCGYECKHTQIENIEPVAATCTKTGTKDGKRCKACKTITTQPTTVPMTAHDYSVLKEYVDGKEPTCTTGATAVYKCKTCDRTQEKNISAQHQRKETMKFEASCSQQGCVIYACEKCGQTEFELLPQLPHTEIDLKAVAATCTTSGLKAGKKCTVCNTITVEQEVIPAGHDWQDKAGKAETCTADGYTAYKECRVCHTIQGKDTIRAGHDFTTNANKCSRCGSRSPDCQHKNASITTTKAATCTADGTQVFKCEDCGDTYTETLTKLGHNYVNGTCTRCHTDECKHTSTYTDKKDATCTATGYEKRICNSCGKVISETVKNKINHTYNHDFCTMCGTPDPNSEDLTEDFHHIMGLS